MVVLLTTCPNINSRNSAIMAMVATFVELSLASCVNAIALEPEVVHK